MGDIQFNGTPEEWDALVKKNKKKEEPKQETLEEDDYSKILKATMVPKEYFGTKQETLEQSAFVKKDDVDGEWLSPVATERVWQEEQLVNIFGHYPNASPRWQYMNGLIQNSLQQERMYSEEEVRELLIQRCKHFGTSLSPFDKILLKQDLEWFEQFKKK